MSRMAARLLVIALALAVSPLHASSLAPAAPGPEPLASLNAALAALPQPMSASAFFELVNAAGGPGYAVGAAQGGTQFMVITLSVSVPGDPAATEPATSLPPGVSNVDSFFDIFTDVSGDAAGLTSDAGAPSDLGSVADLLQPGEYYVLVDGWANDTWIGGYQLDIDPSTTATTEPNDTADEPTDLGTLGAGTDTVTGTVEDLGGSSDADWYKFTVDDSALVTLETAQPGAPDFDTEIWLYDTDGALSACAGDASLAGCDAAGAIFNGVFDLAETCAEQDSSACNLFIEPVAMEPGTYYVRVAYTTFFGDDADPGDYTLDINVEEGVSACLASPTAPGCSQVFDIVDGIYDYNAACSVDPGPVCDANALGVPDGPKTDFYLDLVKSTGVTAGVPTLPGNLSPGDRVLVDLDGNLQTRGDQTITTVAVIPGDREDPSTVVANPLPATYDSLCPLGTDDGACFAAGDIAQTATRLFGECLGNDAGICSQLLDAGDSTLSVNLYPEADSAPGDSTLRINLDPDVTSACQADPTQAGCGGASLLQDAFEGYLSLCDENPTGGCGGLASTGGGGTATGSGAASSSPRSYAVQPGASMGGFTVTESGINTGVFRVTGQTGYMFDATSREYVGAIFRSLPPGSILVTDRFQIRQAPDGKTLLLRDDTGKAFTYPTSSMAPDHYLVPLEADISDPNFTVLTGGGVRIVIPAPFATYVDVGNDPSGVATTPDEIATTAEGGGTGLIGMISSKGGSTGPVFDIRLLNMGKPARVEGDAIFEPLSATEADAVRNALAGLMGSVNSVFDTPGTGYCVEQDKTVPGAGELFRFANAAKSAEFSYAQKVLAGAREVEGAGLLHPDSDPGDYTHSTRQWAIWTAEKSFDKEGFTDSFLEHTREVLAANGTEWSEQIEDAVRGLIDNRWNDVKQVLDAANIPVTEDDRMAATAGAGTAGAMLGLLVAALIAAAVGRPAARGESTRGSATP